MTSSEKKCILVVDDTPTYITLLHMILQQKYLVKAAPNGAIALEIVQKTPAEINLILLDIMMDGMDGFTVCQTLKENPVTAGIPVVFISGKEEDADRKKGLSLGAVDFLLKPFSADTVLETAAKYIK